MKKIVMSGAIGMELTPNWLRAQLPTNGEDLDVHLATPGGFVEEGLEIYNIFRDYKRDNPKSQNMITLKGLVASMGTYEAVNEAFDLVAAEDNAVFMIHNPSNFAWGDYREMEQQASILAGLADLLADKYVEKTGKSKKEIREMMDSTTWLFGDEIKEAGFVDEIIKTDEKENKTSALARSKISFTALVDKMKTHENAKTDIARAAAMLNITDKSKTPANAGKNISEVASMNLDELLAQNPAAKSEFNKKLEDAEKAGYEKGKTDMRAMADKASAFIGNKNYPDQIGVMAVKVIKGEKTMDALDALVSSADMIKEMQASNAAQAESAATGGHAELGRATGQLSGAIQTEADFQAELKRDKERLGIGRK